MSRDMLRLHIRQLMASNPWGQTLNPQSQVREFSGFGGLHFTDDINNFTGAETRVFSSRRLPEKYLQASLRYLFVVFRE
jgi:hypothetical protein